MLIPECLRHLPTYGGLPIPFFISIPTDGQRPDFRLINVRNERLCLRFQLCHVCGVHIASPPYTFTLGPHSIAQRCVFSAPQHRACALAALELCPFLSLERFERSARASHLDERDLVPRDELPDKPSRIALVEVMRYGTTFNPAHALMRETPLYATFGPELESCRMEWYAYRDGVLELEVAR